MIYDTLDEALTDMQTLGTWDPDRLISHYGITYHLTSGLPDNINGYSIPLTRTFFINEKTSFPTFVKCHEFYHCLLDDSIEPLIDTSMVSNSKIESRANHGAFYIMIKNYVNESGIEPQDFDVTRFSDAYCLEPKQQLFIRNIAEDALGIKINTGAFSL
ncbi:hypothetical protein C5Z25_12015 [Lactobacillus sp. CBA3605]|uniref:hypothetical protein n=1 Tax=Lactobacillus sp. CBA3605 TaxID=2099788 RepID=UPI000CFC2AF9|nr:hypothetical protein [Lactobacillus sp. CBA3605]AVK62439.1 hypothetical protein C5Z25_12015 [Lactobacillus sp. CBA3605]